MLGGSLRAKGMACGGAIGGRLRGRARHLDAAPSRAPIPATAVPLSVDPINKYCYVAPSSFMAIHRAGCCCWRGAARRDPCLCSRDVDASGVASARRHHRVAVEGRGACRARARLARRAAALAGLPIRLLAGAGSACGARDRQARHTGALAVLPTRPSPGAQVGRWGGRAHAASSHAAPRPASLRAFDAPSFPRALLRAVGARGVLEPLEPRNINAGSFSRREWWTQQANKKRGEKKRSPKIDDPWL